MFIQSNRHCHWNATGNWDTSMTYMGSNEKSLQMYNTIIQVFHTTVEIINEAVWHSDIIDTVGGTGMFKLWVISDCDPA